jgi:rhomboid protease GluP
MHNANMTTDAAQDHHAEIEFLHRLHGATPRVFVTPALIALNVIVFGAMIATGVDPLGGRPDDYLKFGANFGPLTSGGEWWRLATCTFVHAGILHLLFNMWALWDSGQLTERLFGNAWFAAIYLFAGVTGSFASMLWRNEAVSVGASGAVFGVFGALLAYTIRERGSIPPVMLNRLRISTSIFVTYSLFYGFAASGIDNAAHMGGLAAGLVMGFVGARPLEANARIAGHARRIVLAFLIAAIALPSAARFAPDTSRVYREALALQKAIDAFAADERKLSTAFEEVVKRARDGKLDDKSALKELRGNLLPAWDEAVAKLSAVELDAKAPLRKDYDLLMRFAHARRDMTAALADFLEAGTPASRDRFVEKRKETEAALKEYRDRQARK